VYLKNTFLLFLSLIFFTEKKKLFTSTVASYDTVTALARSDIYLLPLQ